MIAIQKIGKSFLGALNYNFRKLYHPDPAQRAEVLDTNFTALNAKLIRKELSLVKSLRPNLGLYVYHTSLNFSKDDQLDNDKLLAIAHDYLAESGYTNNQYIIFRHHDADHPHIHLLVNRITFDGDVVSDSNNYKKSEAILRKLEDRYNLIAVEQSNPRASERGSYIATALDSDSAITPQRGSYITTEQSSGISQRPATKEELEMVMRTGKPSEKMLLQELMKKMLNQKNIGIKELIRQGEQFGIRFLFNQASTGRVTGITYFHNGFKVKGQALGNSFKWAELIKKVDYEQVRDSKAISEANDRTTAKYGKHTAKGKQRGDGSSLVSGDDSKDLSTFSEPGTTNYGVDEPNEQPGRENGHDTERPLETGQDADRLDHGAVVHQHDRPFDFNIKLIADEDDTKKRRPSRGTGGMAR